MELGKKMLEIRKNKHITQVEAAQLLEVNQSFLSRIENGKKKPSIELLEKAAEIYQVPMTTFFETDKDISHLKNEQNMEFIEKLNNVDLSELLNQYELNFNGKKLNETQKNNIITFIQMITNSNS